MNPALIATATLNHTVLDILYWVNPAKANRAGKMPLSMRLTLRGRRTEISTGIRCLPQEWDVTTKRLRSVKWDAKKSALTVLRELTDATAHLNTLLDSLEAKTRLLAADMRQAQAADQPLVLAELRCKLLGEVAQGPEVLTAFAQALAHYPNPSTRAAYTTAVKSLRQFLAPRQRLYRSELTAERCEEFAAWSEQATSPATAASRVSYLRSLFARLYPKAANPFAKLTQKKAPTARRYVLSQAELAQLAALALPVGSREAVARDIYLAQYYLHGSRVGVVAELSWEQVDWATGRVTFKAEKGGGWHDVAMEPLLAEVLRRYWQGGQGSPLVFPLLPAHYLNLSVDERFPKRKAALTKIWEGLQTVAALLNLPGRLHSHTARHSLATHTVQITKDMRLAQRFLGHSTLQMTERYVAPMLPAELDAGAAQVYGRAAQAVAAAIGVNEAGGRLVPMWGAASDDRKEVAACG